MAFLIYAVPVAVGTLVGYLFTLPVASVIAALAFLIGVVLLLTANGMGLAGIMNMIVGIPLLIGSLVACVTIVLVNNVIGQLDLSWLLRV